MDTWCVKSFPLGWIVLLFSPRSLGRAIPRQLSTNLNGHEPLKNIAQIFSQARSSHEPIAIIQHATLPEQKIFVSTISDIEQSVIENEKSSPAVIVIGNVVNERLPIDIAIKTKLKEVLMG